MKIDITREPPVDIFRNRGKYLWTFIALLFLGGCGVLLGGYAILSDTPYYENLETVSLGLFVMVALLITYIGEKFQAYKSLSPDQKKELVDLGLKHPEIELYCTLVTRTGRQPIRAEYEACQTWAEKVEWQASQKNS